jgi:hypothetical protein
MAAQGFSIKDNFEFVQFEDIGEASAVVPEEFEFWAVMKIYYDGAIPDNYKTLNLLIGDWVEQNMTPLTTSVHEQLKRHFSSFYPESDVSDLDQVEDTAIWTDQLDYMPMVNPSDKSMSIEIELVLHAESID